MNGLPKLILPSARIDLIAGRLLRLAEQLASFADLMTQGAAIQTESNQVAIGRVLSLAERDALGCGTTASEWAGRIGQLAAHVNLSADNFAKFGTWSPSEIHELAQHLRMLARLKPNTYRDNGDAA